ncbi:MAG: GNAT family N-acetyltransferase [Actinobacteria bacterium]|nr:GNAT family N-acetyltransferase [Actinomycetota bacterium]
MTIERVTEATPELLDAFNRLIPQLSRSAPALDEATLHDVVSAPGNVVLIARDSDGAIVGSMTLVTFRIPTGLRAWIEDVVVDGAAGNRGVGTALNREALVRAAAMGVRSIDLTSRPSREAANHLYQKLGFKQRDTNIYRMKLE